MVADLVEEEVKEPECVTELYCEEGVVEQYLDEYENTKLKVQEIMRKVNRLVGWWD